VSDTPRYLHQRPTVPRLPWGWLVQSVRGLSKRRSPTRGHRRTISDVIGATTPGEPWAGWNEAGRDEEKQADLGVDGMTRAASGRGYGGG
jgi:hypothetical protein